MALAEAVDDRASFRRFCGFSSGEAVPERTAFVRLRKALVEQRLDERLFRPVVRQLEAQSLVVKTGTLVDATVIRQAAKTDGEATWCVYGPHRMPVKGYKAHIAADEAGGVVRRVVVTPASTHDSRGVEPVLPARPGRIWADPPMTARRSMTRSASAADRAAGKRAHGAGQGRGPQPSDRLAAHPQLPRYLHPNAEGASRAQVSTTSSPV